MLLYGITVHCYFPGTILSPGYEQENRTKPELTKKLEGGPEEGLTPKQCAEGLIKGELPQTDGGWIIVWLLMMLFCFRPLPALAHDRFFITTDFQTELFRAAGASGGSIPGNGWLLDRVKAFIALVSVCSLSSRDEISDSLPLSGCHDRLVYPSGDASMPIVKSSLIRRRTPVRLGSSLGAMSLFNLTRACSCSASSTVSLFSSSFYACPWSCGHSIRRHNYNCFSMTGAHLRCRLVCYQT